MSFPAYPEYKNSGVEWVGKIPAHWEVCPLMGIAIERFERNAGMIEDNLLSLSYGKIIKKDIFGSDGLLPESFETYQIIYPGDIILRLTDLQNDKRSLRSALVEEKGIITSAYLSLYPYGIDSVFFAYLLRAYDLTKVFYSMGGGLRQSMKFSDMKRIPIILPPLEEQIFIAAFLDRETGKIDALIAEQEKLLTLLVEKRQATISHAVTRGLNPNAPVKDSGVAWLGEVPAHWEILKGSRIGELFGSEPITEEKIQNDGEVPYIKVGSLSLHRFSIENWNWFVSASVGARCHPRSNFIVFPKRGAAIFTNKVNIVETSALIDPNLMGWKIGGKATSSFIAYVLKVRRLEELADVSTVPQINNKHIAPELFPVPPPEQRAIVEFLNTETSKLDDLKKAAELAIDLFKERRSALIAAAVTGKIDVRNAVPKGEAA